jgi:hypothetical protein
MHLLVLLGFGLPCLSSGALQAEAANAQYRVLPLASNLHAQKNGARSLIPIQSGHLENNQEGQWLNLTLSPDDTVFLSRETGRSSRELPLTHKNIRIQNAPNSIWKILAWTETNLPNGMKQLQISALNKSGTKLNLRALLRI